MRPEDLKKIKCKMSDYQIRFVFICQSNNHKRDLAKINQICDNKADYK